MTTTPAGETTSIVFSLPGIAELLGARELTVPVYQRSYSWRRDQQVADFWSDLGNAFGLPGEYFLGTIVLATEGKGGRRTVIDGQQRLATTSLLLAAIRDELKGRGHNKAAIVERDYLAKETLTSDGKDPRLILNTDDDPYFRRIVSGEGAPESSVPSQKLLRSAYELLCENVSAVAAGAGTEADDRLLDWVSFLSERVRIGVIEVPTEADAYVIFETLNDRGADLTTADLLKNFLYGRAGKSLPAVRENWARVLGALDLTTADARLTAFLRHYWSSVYGSTREKDLYKAIKSKIDSQKTVATLSRDLAKSAAMYAAIGNPIDEWWTTLGSGARTDVEILARFNLAPNRPLLLAAMDKFPPTELKRLLRALVSWSVRGMILETMNSGTTEERYCEAAVDIRAGNITKVAQLRTKLATVVPGDTAFKSAFAIAQVTKTATARYYLAALERGLAKDREPELVPNNDADLLTLEHVLPRNAEVTVWTAFGKTEEVNSWAHRLGNMVLLPKGKNRGLGRKSFAGKKSILATSKLSLTSNVGGESVWTSKEIDRRQKKLADLAVYVWPR